MFDLEAYCESRREIVDAALDDVLPAGRSRPARLHQAMRYGVLSGGKRIRPTLCMAAAEALGASGKLALLPGLATELLHAYTLMHDDLPCMDNDLWRRGKPTVHMAFGEACALLAGDALQALAFEVLARASAPAPYDTGRLVAELAGAAGSRGVVGGQVVDLAAVNASPTPATIDFIHARKTAALFRAAVRMGAMVAGADSAQLAAFTDYAVNLGIAFQIADDLLDATPQAVGVFLHPWSHSMNVLINPYCG